MIPDLTSGRITRIVLVRIGKIGDLIVSNFAFRKIRREFPAARIVLVTLPRNRELLRYNRAIDVVRFYRLAPDLPLLLARINAFRPEVLLDFNDNPSRTSALISRWCGAPVRVGFAFPGKRLTHPVACPPHEQTHITERLRLIPEAIGVTFDPEEIRPSMDLGPAEEHEARQTLEALRSEGVRCVAINLSAGDPSRYWPTSKWTELLRHAALRDPATAFLLLTAPGEEHLAREIRGALRSLRFISPPGSSFHHFAASIATADLLLSPDTSAVHIASAFRVPVLGLYPASEWNFRSWQPLGTRFEIVRPTAGTVEDIGVEAALQAYDHIVHPPA